MKYSLRMAAVIGAIAGFGLLPSTVKAATACSFDITGSTMSLLGSCETSSSILIGDGLTLEGNGFTITAVDPEGSHFKGAVIRNAGTTANVNNVIVTASDLANVCDGGADRLRGIMFEGASGSITNSTVIGINQGPSGCQEGNSIEVRNEPFDGSHPNTKFVDIAFNNVFDYQKTGILVNGDVSAIVRRNELGSSATQQNLAANGIQIGFGAIGNVKSNKLRGNQWLGGFGTVATGMIIYQADPATRILGNTVLGNAEIGLYVEANSIVMQDNKLHDTKTGDTTNGDYGIYSYGVDNVSINNLIVNYDVPELHESPLLSSLRMGELKTRPSVEVAE